MSDFTYVVTVDQGPFAKKALYQVKSIVQNNPDTNIFAYITEGGGTESLDSTEREWLEEQAEVQTGPVPHSDYPISAKTQAAVEASSAVSTDHLLILDSDMLILEDLEVPEGGQIAMTPVNIGDQEWGKQKQEGEWKKLCDKYGIDYPERTLYSTVDEKPLIFPMYNVGVVFVENNDFADRWRMIEAEMYEEYGGFHFLHQIAASLLAADYDVNVLSESYNYPSNIRLYCPSDIKILHYHKFDQLRKLMHPKVRKKVGEIGIKDEQSTFRSFWSSSFTPVRLRFLRSILR